MLFTDFLFGMIAMQGIYLVFHFILIRKGELLSFLLFTISVTTFVVLLNAPQNNRFSQLIGLKKLLPFSFAFLFFASAMYYRFTRYFIEAQLFHKSYNKIIQIAEVIALSTFFIFVLKLIFTNEVGFLIPLGKAVFIINIPFQIYVVAYLFTTRKVLNYLLAIGSLFMTVFFKAGLVPLAFIKYDGFSFQEQLLSILLGLVINFMFFVFILVYKSRQNERQKLILEIQKQEELERQRREISNDLHDDLGSVLSSLHVYSSIAYKDFTKNGNRTGYYLQKVTDGIRTAMDNMGDVIWAVRNEQENEKAFSSRIKDFFIDVFDASNIECVYEIDHSTEKAITGILSRKYLLLIAKEAINNAIKHSSASQLFIRLYPDGDMVNLEIEDNGIGFDESSFKNGNGLTSLRERTSRLQGSLLIDNVIPQGTKIRCVIPLTIIRDK